MRVIKISKGETVNGSITFINNKGNSSIFNFENKRWQKIGKIYEWIMFIVGLISFVCLVSLPDSFPIPLISTAILFFFTKRTRVFPKKYFLKSVKITRRTIEFEYYDSKKKSFTFSTNEVRFFVYSYDERVEVVYSKHTMIFTNATEMTTFLNKVMVIAKLDFYESIELGMNKEMIKYKVL